MRKKIIAGNWKMNKDIHETAALIAGLTERLKAFRDNVEVVICPPFTSLVVAQSLVKGTSIGLGAQNMSQHDDGAFTGEISGQMLCALGCRYVILGHSERRQYFGETDSTVNAKLKKALASGLTPIVCVGETLEEREKNLTESTISLQIKGVLHELSSADLDRLIIAYEPVWAIGTGRNATPAQANDVHRLIRRLVSQISGWPSAEKVRIQYGGSMNPQNAADLLSQPDVDGGLIGGASLKAEAFMAIVRAASEISA